MSPEMILQKIHSVMGILLYGDGMGP
jgi:hypothetical protein